MRMLEQRIDDQRFLGLIRKWLKAGILEEDGKIIYPITGTPQGGVISAVLANIYLHYAIDLWFERVVKPQCQGDVMLMRFADDFVCCFQLQQDCRRCYKELGLRLGKFKLELSATKTRVIKFTRFETKDNESFDFLGFEYRWSTSRTGKPLMTMQTSKKKFRIALAAILSWIKEESRRLGTTAILNMLRQKLQGHWNYYGVSGNIEMLSRFYWKVRRIIYKWLNRRSQRRSCNWQVFSDMLNYHKIPKPRIIGYWN